MPMTIPTWPAPHPHCLLRFGLDDEALSVTHLPHDLSDLGIDGGNKDVELLNLSVLHGELCLTGYRVNETSDVHRLGPRGARGRRGQLRVGTALHVAWHGPVPANHSSSGHADATVQCQALPLRSADT